MTREELLKRAKPILFNTDMVRAILDGRKTVTRRVVKLPSYVQKQEDGLYTLFADGTCYENLQMEEMEMYLPSPCRKGDILYVRETWGEWTGGYVYKAWNEPFPQAGCYPDHGTKWHPSIHMPKEAARIFLKVTDVRIERVQDITEEQAKKEGAINNIGFIHSPDNEYTKIHTAKEDFQNIWDSTIKKAHFTLYGWNANPWVWVIEFEQYELPAVEQ